MVKVFTLLVFLATTICAFAQQTKEEILLEKLSAETIDSVKAFIYMDLHNEVFRTNLEKAEEYANEILKYGLMGQNWHVVEIGYLALARCERKKRNYDAVIPLDFKALEYAKKLANLNQIFVCTSQIANDYLDAENEKDGVKYMLLATDIAAKSKSPVSIGKAYETIGYYYYQKDKPTQALPYLKQAVENSLKGLDLFRANRSRTWLGFCLMQLHQTKGLLEMTFEALEYFKKANLITSQAECYRLLGFCNLSSGDYNNAFTNYAKAKQIYQDTGNIIEQAMVETDIAKNYIGIKNYENAKKSIEEAEQIFTNNKYERGIITCKTLWGQYYSSNNQYKLANIFFVEANNLLKKNPKEDLLINNETYWAENAYRQKNIKRGDSLTYLYSQRIADTKDPALTQKFLNRLKNNHKQIDSIAFEDLKILFAKGGAQLLHKKYPHKSLKQIIPVVDSLASLSPYNSTSIKQDSVANASFNNHLLELETQYRTHIKDDSIKLERQNAVIIKDELKTKNSLLTGSMVFVLLLAGGFMVQRKYRIQAETDKKQIELLKNEIHHRIKNNLAVITRMVEVAENASITSISSASLKNRVNAIGLLHQHLYQDKLIDEVNLQNYLTSLTTAIKNTFENDKMILIEVDAPIALPGLTAERIGLLINELVTNSFKYAFEGLTKGHIKIAGKRSIPGNTYAISVCDNGKGMNFENGKGNYGLKLITGLCYELNGKFSFSNNQGTHFELKFTDTLKK